MVMLDQYEPPEEKLKWRIIKLHPAPPFPWFVLCPIYDWLAPRVGAGALEFHFRNCRSCDSFVSFESACEFVKLRTS